MHQTPEYATLIIGDFVLGAISMPNVLCIEDEFEVGQLFKKMLTRHGHHVITAINGKIGIAMAHSQHLDLVLLDLNMPDMSGFDVLAELRSIAHMQSIPIIAVTALPMREKCLEAGFDEFLNKPVMPNELSKLIEQFL
jgi:two-component system, cell cycle response regulator DivK